GLGRGVNEISKAMDKGKHTTVTRQLFPLEGGGYVADTPGWKSLALWDTEPEEIDGYFPELRQLVQHCQFNDCTHTHEPDCAVRRALEEGKIHPERYESYLRLRSGQDQTLILKTDNWNLIGNEWAVDMLKKHIANGTTRHAYLFAGPPGLGRRTLALRFAQALNCQTPVAAGIPCGACRDCRQIEAMQHADLTIVEAEAEG